MDEELEPATSKFHQSLPYAYLAVSPTLSALHATRIKRQHALENPDFCSRCGTFLLDGLSSSRLKRVKKKCNEGRTRRIRAVQCRGCGFANDIEVREGNAVIYGRRNGRLDKDSIVVVPEPEPEPEVVAKTPLVAKIPTPSPSTPAPKLRQKKKSVLQDMLARNRAREERDKSNQNSTGLAAFLSGL
ncbi:uncharacterized protein EV420DRAFT_453867 [Desarmillaria tabescens]|uniref:Rpr2-domain-containing protein n=1 Tax=Armillaria tabescens TaxID=1929756 RepID=A0AA39TRU8_ARMTA|nr:uncharacterized protein EV420DRAFT_453867 [Desarmillaria tabescens]KAK0468252.1 hypothetical protein EV420DRAFT_453867 [Desarmillaria tabescens]